MPVYKSNYLTFPDWEPFGKRITAVAQFPSHCVFDHLRKAEEK
jgi:hypothetical protein